MNLVPLSILIYLISIINPILAQQHSRLSDSDRGDKLNYLYNFLNRNGHQQMCALLRSAKLENYLANFEYTLISPTDEAFALIPLQIRQRLQNDTEFRLQFVKNHIINGRLFFSSISNGQQILINAVSNNKIHIAAYSNGYVINGAQLLVADRQIESTPNLAQFVDRPIYLESTLNLIDYLNENYKQMQRFIEIAGLQDELQDDKDRTIFVPNDDAFRSLPWTVIEQMYNNNTFLKNVLKSHIVNGIHYSLGLQNGRQQLTILRSQNGEKLQFKTKKLQGRNLVFVNDIPIVNADQQIKNGVIHEISKINLPKQLIEDCDCIVEKNQSDRNQSSINANLIKKDILIISKPLSNDAFDYYPHTKQQRYNQLNSNNTFKSTIIPESMKRKYMNLHNRPYRPIETSLFNQQTRTNESMFRPMVFYDKSDLNYYTTSTPKIPISYYRNHNYYNNKINKLNYPASANRSTSNFYITDDNSLAFPAHSYPSYSTLPNDNKSNLSAIESPFLSIFDPFSPYANQTFSSNNPYIDSKNQFHSTTVNISQSSPSMTHYMTHVFHGDKNAQLFTSSNPVSSSPFIYNMDRLALPNIETNANNQQSTTFKSILYQVVPTVSPNLIDYGTKNKQKIVSSSKYYNDLTTPTPIYFDPTRKPKSPSYLNRIRRVNDLINSNNQYNLQSSQNLQTSYQVLDSNVVQKIEDTKTSSNNNNQQVIAPARLDLNRNRFNIKSNQFNGNQQQTSQLNRPIVTLATVNSNNYFKNQTRNGRILKNMNRGHNNAPTPYITLFDVLKNPYLQINNEPIEFTQFENLLNQTNLVDLLRNNKGQLTLILPTNSAFSKLKDYELDYLKLKQIGDNSPSFYSSAMRKKRQLYVPRQEEELRRIQIIKNLVLNHISPIFVNPDSIDSNEVTAKSYSNYNLKFVRISNKLFLNNMPVLATTVVSNGVAYVVDNLIMNSSTLFDVINEQDQKEKKAVSSIDTILNPTLTKLDTSKLNSSMTPVQIIDSIPELSFFAGLVKKSNFYNLLSNSEGIYTLLAPENKAFSYLPHYIIDQLKISPSFIDRFVSSHIINANFSINNLIVSPIVLNLNKMPIKVNSNNGMILLNDTSMMRKTNVPTSTGFIHILTHSLVVSEPYSSSNVMLLNRKPILIEPTLQDQLMEIAKTKSSAKFLTLFIQNNYVNMFRNAKKNFTLILPSDIAYYSLPENVINKMENSTSRLKSLLNYHLLNQLFDPYDLEIIDQLSSITGLPLHYMNVSALNDQKLNTFSLVGLDSRLKQSMSYSMVNNETMMQQKNQEPLMNIGKLIEQLRLNSETNQLTISGSTINDVRIIEIDNQNSSKEEKNYIEILFVDRVLYTPKGTIYDLIKSSPMLTILNQLIEITNLKDELNWLLDDHSKHKHKDLNATTRQTERFGYTFFAPSNAAFQRLGLDLVEQLKKNIETAKVFLLRHLVRRPLFTSSISINGSLIENSTGEHLNLQRNGDIVVIEGVAIDVADITTTNGVVHVIENVL